MVYMYNCMANLTDNLESKRLVSGDDKNSVAFPLLAKMKLKVVFPLQLC